MQFNPKITILHKKNQKPSTLNLSKQKEKCEAALRTGTETETVDGTEGEDLHFILLSFYIYISFLNLLLSNNNINMDYLYQPCVIEFAAVLNRNHKYFWISE